MKKGGGVIPSNLSISRLEVLSLFDMVEYQVNMGVGVVGVYLWGFAGCHVM